MMHFDLYFQWEQVVEVKACNFISKAKTSNNKIPLSTMKFESSQKRHITLGIP